MALHCGGAGTYLSWKQEEPQEEKSEEKPKLEVSKEEEPKDKIKDTAKQPKEPKEPTEPKKNLMPKAKADSKTEGKKTVEKPKEGRVLYGFIAQLSDPLVT